MRELKNNLVNNIPNFEVIFFLFSSKVPIGYPDLSNGTTNDSPQSYY